MPVAREELEFAAGLCHHPVNTIIAIERNMAEDGIQEQFRVVAQPMTQPQD